MAKRTSRAAQQDRLRVAAQDVAVPSRCDVVVVGGGAAGLVAAIVAAEAGACTVVLERDLTCGKPILATGNGRCNFANRALDVQRYNQSAFVESVCGGRWLEDVLEFFRNSGLRWCEEEGRLYPLSRQAASVRNVLLARAQRAGAVLAPAREVTSVSASSDGGVVEYRDPHGVAAKLSAACAVIALGRRSAADLVREPHLESLPQAPVLCPLACESSPLGALDGRRAHAEVRLVRGGAGSTCWHGRGEVLFRSYGLSGIVIFDASRRAVSGDLLEIDLLPDISANELQQLADPAGGGRIEPGRLDGVLDPVVANLLERLTRERWCLPAAPRPRPADDVEALIALVKALPFRVTGPADAQHAQVMRGGLDVDQFDTGTLAARACSRLFACGEALDVDGDCGGFNLAWAWKSGMVAGAAAAQEALR